MDEIRAVLLDESFFYAEDKDGNPFLLPAAESLFRRLSYSKLRTGISYKEGISSEKDSFLTGIAKTYSFDAVVLNASCIHDSFDKVLASWTVAGETCCYVTSKTDKGLFLKLINLGWKIVSKGTEDSTIGGKNLLFISKLEELPITLIRFRKMAVHDTAVIKVGYVMKPSREEDFAKRGAFPMHPTQNGLMFVPLTFDLPLASQLQEVDVILHKATDEIVSIKPDSFLDLSKGICFSKGMQELERYIQDHPDCCVIDPVPNIYPLLDRNRIQGILLGLEDLNTGRRCRIRAPHFLKVENFCWQNLAEGMSRNHLSLPNIVKPQVACGVADAHSMAIVFRLEDFKNLRVPLPAIVQEYVDHSSLIFKFYVLGEKVFHAVRKSMPNVDVLLSSSEKNGSGPITFDSLKSLPTGKQGQDSGNMNKQSMDIDLVTDAANWLRRRLDLTLFGFDVVIQEGSGDHVIVDVNYLPSFKEIPDDVAIPAFWDATRSSYSSRRKNKHHV